MGSLKTLLRYVSNNIPYYINYFKEYYEKDPENLYDYPIIDKQTIINNMTDFITKGKRNTNNEIFVPTSGTTGMPLNILKTNKENITQLKSIWNVRYNDFDILPNSRILRFAFRDCDDPVTLEHNYLIINIFKMNIETIYEINKKIEDFKPIFIMATPSVICEYIELSRYVNMTAVNSVKYIEVMGELLFDYQKKYIYDYFKCVPRNHYGCAEIWGIAQECKCGKMHILSENAIVEISKDSDMNGYGELIVTGLNSYIMPFVRYKTGDIGKIQNSICQCGRNSDVIILKEGRKNEFVYLEENKKVHSAVFYQAIKNINNIENLIFSFNITQEDYTHFTVILSTFNCNNTEKIKSLFLKEMKKWFNESVEFNIVFSKQNRNNKKFTYFTSLIKKDYKEN